MKLKLIIGIILCLSMVNTSHAISVDNTKICCVYLAQNDSTESECACWAAFDGDCSNCKGGGIGGGGIIETGCPDCESSDWAASGTEGYEVSIDAICQVRTGFCDKTYSYRCASGYYGSSLDGVSGCTRCPSSGGIYGSSAAGSTEITACYIPANTQLSDTTGTFIYSDDCYYSE